MSKKGNVIEADGLILKENGNGFFRIELDEPAGHVVLCTISGKLQKHKIRLLEGDRVTIQMSPYDLTHGRVTMRHK